MNVLNITLFFVLAAVAVVLAFSVLHMVQSRRHEERLLNRSARTVATLISRKTRLNHLLGNNSL